MSEMIEDPYNQLAEIAEKMATVANETKSRRLTTAAVLLAEVVRLLHAEQEWPNGQVR